MYRRQQNVAMTAEKCARLHIQPSNADAGKTGNRL